VQDRDIVVGNRADKPYVSPSGELSKKQGVVPLWWPRIVASGSRDGERRSVREGAQEDVDALVRRDSAQVQHTPSPALAFRSKPCRIDAAIDDPGTVRRCLQDVGGVLRNSQEAFEQRRQQAAPATAAEPMIGRDPVLARHCGRNRGDAAGCAAELVSMYDVGAAQRPHQLRRYRLSRVATEQAKPAQRKHPQAARLLRPPRGGPEGQQHALHVPGEGARQLQRVTFSTSEQPARSERRGDDMDDAHVLTVSLVTLGDPGTMTGGYLYHRRIADLAPSFDARVGFVSVPAWRFPLPVAAGPTVLRSVVRQRPDALLLDSIAAAFLGPSLWRRPPVPLVGILHQPPGGIDHGRVRSRLQAVLDRRAYRHAARLLVASEDLADRLRTDGVPQHLLRVVPPGRDVAPQAVVPSIDLRAGRNAAVLSVGNWVARKGLLDLLDAVGALPADAVTLHLIGDTEAEPGYARQVRARLAAPDLAGRVVVHGRVSVEEVAGFYRAADVFALTSVREPYGTVYGEAMAAGLPVVGWDAGNLPHLARDGVEGRVVPVGNTAALTAALAELAADESVRRRLGAAAARRAAAFPSWQDTARLLFDELRTVVREARA
jgi:glycosyltransferase involved in cell wall biosynthesis